MEQMHSNNTLQIDVPMISYDSNKSPCKSGVLGSIPGFSNLSDETFKLGPYTNTYLKEWGATVADAGFPERGDVQIIPLQCLKMISDLYKSD